MGKQRGSYTMSGRVRKSRSNKGKKRSKYTMSGRVRKSRSNKGKRRVKLKVKVNSNGKRTLKRGTSNNNKRNNQVKTRSGRVVKKPSRYGFN